MIQKQERKSIKNALRSIESIFSLLDGFTLSSLPTEGEKELEREEEEEREREREERETLWSHLSPFFSLGGQTLQLLRSFLQQFCEREEEEREGGEERNEENEEREKKLKRKEEEEIRITRAISSVCLFLGSFINRIHHFSSLSLSPVSSLSSSSSQDNLYGPPLLRAQQLRTFLKKQLLPFWTSSLSFSSSSLPLLLFFMQKTASFLSSSSLFSSPPTEDSPLVCLHPFNCATQTASRPATRHLCSFGAWQGALLSVLRVTFETMWSLNLLQIQLREEKKQMEEKGGEKGNEMYLFDEIEDFGDESRALLFRLYKEMSVFMREVTPSVPPFTKTGQDVQLHLTRGARFSHWYCLLLCDLVWKKRVLNDGRKEGKEIEEKDYLLNSILGIFFAAQGGSYGEEYICARQVAMLFDTERVTLLEENLERERKRGAEPGGEPKQIEEEKEKEEYKIGQLKQCYLDLFGANDPSLLSLSKRSSLQLTSLSSSLFLTVKRRVLSLPFIHPWVYSPLVLLRHHRRGAMAMIEEEKKYVREKRAEKELERRRKRSEKKEEREGGGEEKREKKEEEEEEEEEEIEFNEELKELALKFLSPTHSHFLSVVLRFISSIESLLLLRSSLSFEEGEEEREEKEEMKDKVKKIIVKGEERRERKREKREEFGSPQCKMLYTMSVFLLSNTAFLEEDLSLSLSLLKKIFFIQEEREEKGSFFGGEWREREEDGGDSFLFPSLQEAISQRRVKRERGKRERDLEREERAMTFEGGVYSFVCSLVEQFVSVSFGSSVFADFLLLFLQRGGERERRERGGGGRERGERGGRREREERGEVR